MTPQFYSGRKAEVCVDSTALTLASHCDDTIGNESVTGPPTPVSEKLLCKEPAASGFLLL